MLQNPTQAEHGDRGEPDQHDRPEYGADSSRAAALKQEKRDEDGKRDCQDHSGLERGRCYGETFNRR